MVVLLVFGFWPRPIPVEIAVAATGTLRAMVNEEGKTRIKQRYLISAPVSGQLRRIPFKAGAEVQAGKTVLAVIDPLPPTLLDARSRSLAEARRDEASANLDKARAAYTFAASELKRFEQLSADKAISVQELEGAQWREASNSREQAAAQSALRQAEAELAEFTQSTSAPLQSPREIKAPANGRVLRVFEENARVVAGGASLMEIGDPTDLEVVIDVLSRDGAVIAPGTKVELEQWGGGAPLAAQVRLVEPAAFTKVSALGVEEQRVNVIADLLSPPDQRPAIGDNFRVEAHIIVWEANNALKVPSGALFRRGDDWATFVISDSHAHLRAVKPGRSSGPETQVIEGLRPGEKIILYPGSTVRDGQRVKEIKT